MALPSFGSFDAFNLPKMDREMLTSGLAAVKSVEGGWEFLTTYAPPDGQGFMFSPSEGKRKEIDDAVALAYPGHSGASYGMTMRNLEFIAKHGWEAYARGVLDSYGPSPAAQFATTLAAAKAADNFLATNPPLEISAFADAIQKDPGMRARIPDIDAQASALKRFAEGKLTYAEMRSLCG